MDHIGHFPHSPRITRDGGTPACKYPLAVLFHLCLRHSLEPHVSISARVDIFDEGHVFFPVVVFRLGDRDIIVLVRGQTHPVIVCLYGIVTFVCGACLIRSVLPPAVDLSGARLRKFRSGLPSETERHSGGSSKISFVCGIDEYPSVVDFSASVFTVENFHCNYPVSLHLQIVCR